MNDFLKESFDNIDHNRDGEISLEELHEALKRGQPNMQFDSKTVQILMSQYDKNHDNEICFKEFYELFVAINELYNDFLDIDKDFSGYIDSNELENALKSKGFEYLSSSFFADLTREISKRNQIKGVSFDVFVRVISRLYNLLYEFENSSHNNLEDFMRKSFFIKF